MNSVLQEAFRRFADFLVRHPRLVIGLLVASLAITLPCVRRVHFDFSPQAIYRGDDKLVGFSEEFKQTFGYDEAVVLVVLEAAGPADTLTAPALQWQREIAGDFQRIEGVQSVDSVATLQIPRMTLSGMELQPLVNDGPVDEDAAHKARGLLENQPLVRSGLLSLDDRVAAIAIFLKSGSRDISAMRQVVGAVRAAVAARPPPAGDRVHFSGLPVLRVEVVDELQADQLTLMPVAGLVYLGVLAVLFRKISSAVVPLVAVGIGLTWTLATLAVTHQPVNLVTNVLPVLLLIIGVSSSVQIVGCYAEETVIYPDDRARAAREAIVKMTPACLLAALTTAIGFASLATAQSVLLRSFGWQAAAGVGYQYVCTLIALGAALRFLAPPRLADETTDKPGRVGRLISAAGTAVTGRPWRAIAGATIVMAAALWGSMRVVINSYSVLETFSESHPAVQTLRLVERQLAGIMPLEISLEAGEEGAFLEPDVFHNVLAIEREAREFDGVLAVRSYADLLRAVLVHWPGRRLSETDEQLAPPGTAGRTRLARTESFVERFRDAFHYGSYMSDDGRRARIQLQLKEIGSRRTIALIERLQQRLARSFPAGGAITATLTGEALVNAQSLTALIRNLFFSLFTASLVIFGLIALEFRSLRAGLIAAIPNLTPLLVTLGYMGLRRYDMNVSNVIVFTICLGLADDNTIHFLYRFRDELHSGGSVPEAIEKAFHGTGRAIVATSFLLLAGMAVLLLSNFVPTRRFAELTCVTIIGNLLGVLLLLPACLVLAWRPRKVPRPAVRAAGAPESATCPRNPSAKH